MSRRTSNPPPDAAPRVSVFVRARFQPCRQDDSLLPFLSRRLASAPADGASTRPSPIARTLFPKWNWLARITRHLACSFPPIGAEVRANRLTSNLEPLTSSQYQYSNRHTYEKLEIAVNAHASMTSIFLNRHKIALAQGEIARFQCSAFQAELKGGFRAY